MDRAGAGTIPGPSRTVRGGRTIEYEFVVILAAPAGTLVHHAHRSGRLAAGFRLLRLSPREVVFENAGHDFPRRFGYRLEEDGTLAAWIEDLRGGALKRTPFPMRRVSCAAANTQR
jgi:hypothetical protein